MMVPMQNAPRIPADSEAPAEVIPATFIATGISVTGIILDSLCTQLVGKH